MRAGTTTGHEKGAMGPPCLVAVFITLRVMVSPHAEREDYFKAGKETGALAEAAQ